MAPCLCETLDNYGISVMFLLSLKTFCMEESQAIGLVFFPFFFFSFVVRIYPVDSITIMTKKMHLYYRALGKTSLEATSLSSMVPSHHI